jgi:predicted nucleic acid-binding protein
VKYLIDTNIISEVRKGEQCDTNVARWYASLGNADIYLSVSVLGEVRKGIEGVRRNSPERARVLEFWLATLRERFTDRILPVNQMVADEWGRMSAIRSVPSLDALLAATAKVNQMTFATRNVADVAGLGADVINPFDAQ